ncbi:ResB-like family protein [Polystyrenella longa]|uniref:ResB-like family protein n=1 Tax=Polystyrenella longa TaxID=2528007 RepID=A0A518CR60_9PLAN|nr:cytochrome c biogenesis protein ResB [Polystyrenella longa]QDU81700.1 ResB-like family protein [Polystyrenella longa]
MARPKIYDSSQPLPVRSLLWLYEFLASLKLAVILILSLAIVLAYATFVEAHLGTKAVQWYLYHSGAFAGLLSLLAINIFCAASIRYPWKRHQTGFVVTHIGLLVLLGGSAISFMGSLNSQMLVFLDDSSQMAIDLDESGYLQIDGLPDHPETFTQIIPLGPFNWNSYHDKPFSQKLSERFGWSSEEWEHDPLSIYKSDNYQIDVVNYYSASEVHQLPFLDLTFSQEVIGAEMDIDLEWQEGRPFAEAPFGGMGNVLMWKTEDPKDLKRFQEARPQRFVAGDGVLAVWSEGEVYHINVAELQRLKEKEEGPYELDNGLQLELLGFAPTLDLRLLTTTGEFVSQSDQPQMPAVELLITEPSESEEGKPKEYRIVRLARYPVNTIVTRPDDFYVEYYHPEMEGRVDILMGPDNKLAYRVWQKGTKMVVGAGDLNVNESIDTWSMGGGKNVWSMRLNRFLTPDEDNDKSWDVFPVEFSKEADGQSKRIKVRVTWKEDNQTKTDEFWLGQNLPSPWVEAGRSQIHRTDLGDGEGLNVSYNVRQTDVGFAMKLLDFDLDVDPGTSMAANYTSHLLQLDVRNRAEITDLQEQLEAESNPAQRQVLSTQINETRKGLFTSLFKEYEELPEEKREEWIASHDEAALHVITMNEPLDYPDLEGRPLRFFQENYLPPDPPARAFYGSIFRVNYDPGRPVKYLGSALITLGIFLMFYMRAYFFKRTHKQNVTAEQAGESVPQPSEEEPVSV